MNTVDLISNGNGGGFAKTKAVKQVSTGWKQVLVIPNNGSALVNLKNDVCSLLLTVAHSDSVGVITALANNGPYPATERAIVRLTTGGDLQTGEAALEVFYGTTVDLEVSWTDLTQDKDSKVVDAVVPANDAVEMTLLDVGGTRGVQTTGTFKTDGNEVYHLGNLPPRAASEDVVDGTSDETFVTPFSLKPTLEEISKNPVMDIFYEHPRTVEQDYLLGENRHATAVGPITVASGMTIKLESGATLKID